MFSTIENNRKRPRRNSNHENDDENATSTTAATAASSTSIASKDVNVAPVPVVCLTGFSPKEKDHYHTLIESLGGRYTQDLNSSRNTHLVAKAPQGAKYEAALKLNSRIVTVGPLWLKDCHQQQAWIDPPLAHHRKISLDETKIKKRSASAAVHKTNAPDILIPSLKRQLVLDDSSASSAPRAVTLLFIDCQFFLVGFEQEERNLMTSLVGRGHGTIYWELHDSITHVIVKDECNDKLREASERISVQHPNAPVFVSPWWILACCQLNALQDPSDFEPKYRQTPAADPCHKKTKPNNTMASRNNNNKQLQGNLFRGCMFAFLRVSPPPGTVDCTTSDLEALIASQNGQLLSSQILDALKVDLSRNNTARNNKIDDATPINKKKCYVICWGGGISGGTESVMMMHPLLAQVKRRELADIVEATPIWLQTCCTEQRIVPPQRLTILFQPTAWAIRSFSFGQQQHQHQKSTSGEKQVPAAFQKPPAALRISVSGFSGSRRTAMIHLITLMGAFYDDSMRTSTTHLICRKACGLKYQKAMEWKLHVVSIDWLYHVAQYGYKGKQQQQKQQAHGFAGAAGASTTTCLSAVGCEDRFTLTTTHDQSE